MKSPVVITVLIAALMLWVLYGYMNTRGIEKPNYTVVDPKPNGLVAKARNIELRKYDAMLVAEATVPGPYDEAINRGFMKVADYIFGNNTTKE